MVDAQGIGHAVEQASDGIGRDRDAELAQLVGDSGGGAARPAEAGHGIASGIVFEQAMEDGNYVAIFF